MNASTSRDQTSPGAWRRTGAIRVVAGVALAVFAVTYRPLAGHPAPRAAFAAGLVLSAVVVARGVAQWALAGRASHVWTIALLWLDAHLVLAISLAYAFDPRSFPYVLLPVVWAETAATAGLWGGLLLWAESSAVFSAIEIWAASAFGVEAEPIGLVLRAAVGLVFVLLAVSLVRRGEEHRRQRVSVEERYRTLVERIPAVTYLRSGTTGRELTYVSPQAEDLLGYASPAMLETPALWQERIHPEDRARAMEADRQAADAGGPFACEYRWVRPDGRIVWLHDEAVPVPGEDGAPGSRQGFVYDVSQRREAERRIAAAEERFRNLVERLPAVTYIETAARQWTVYVSPQVERILGYAAPEWAAARAGSVHPDDRAVVAAAAAHADETGEPFVCEYRVLRRDGSIAWLHDESVLVLDEHGSPLHWQGVLFDITERRDAEEEVRRALAIEREAAARLRALDEMKTTFLHAVSHELRTPLAAILGYAVTLERRDMELDPDEATALLSRLAANARKLDRLLSDLLDLDRLDRGVVEPRRRPTDVGELVRQVVQETGALDGRPLHLALDPVVVAIEPAKVERIVENLLANTVRHTPPDTPVWVWVRRADTGAVIGVEDAGDGVPPELRDSIFEPFHQGPGIPAHSPGVGIGLSLVARFAELHGGRAWVEERPGGGSSFRVHLPDPRPAEPPAPDGVVAGLAAGAPTRLS